MTALIVRSRVQCTLLWLAVVVIFVASAAAKGTDEGTLTLVGPGATRPGHAVTFTGRFGPTTAGVRVGIYLGSSVVSWATTNASGFFVARPRVFRSGDYRARSRGLVSPAHHVRVVRPLLRRGSQSLGVRRIALRLSTLGYAVNSPSTLEFTGALRQSVYAFQKSQGIAVDGIVGPETRALLQHPHRLTPLHTKPADHIEIDKERQLVLLVREGRVTTIINASTAGIPGDHTPEGTFHVFRRVRGIDTSPLGKLYDPLYFYRGYAIHGSTNVPPTPASHGCVRIPIWESARLLETVPHGETVYVY